MAAEVSSDLNCIQDEDVLRRMWQQTEDFSRKKEIRSRMYKLREQRLKDFYTTGEVLSDTMSSRKYTGTTHTDSIGDQGFLTMKTKEIRDSESPTREIRRREDDNNYWNTVQQQTSYYTSADGDSISQSYEKTFADRGVSDDGNVQTQIAADEKGFHSSSLREDEHSKTQTDQSSRNAHVVSSLQGKSDNGDYQYFTSSNKEDNKTSSFKTSQVSDTSNVQSSQWAESSSSSSSSTRRVVSSSSYKYEGNTDDRLLSRDLKSITAGDSDRLVSVSDDSRNFIQQESSTDDAYNTAKSYHVTSSKNASSTFDTKDVHSTEIDINVNSSVPTKQTETVYYNKNDTDSDLRTSNRYEDTYTYRTSSPTTKVDKTIYKTELTSDVQDYSTADRQHIANITKSETDKTNVVVDQKIMTELQNLDTFLSTQNTTGTSTPVSPRSVTGDAANWTVVSNTDGEFVYSIDKRQKTDDTESVHTDVSRVRNTGQPSSLDIPKEYTSGQYVTTYQQSYNNKRISVDNSPTHEAFARSLRQSPPSTPRSTTPRSLSKGSLDRSSPERKLKSSPFTSPDKERRGSVGSHTVDKTRDTKRKISETVKHGTSDVTVKNKRKLSSTQTKASSKTRASTPGTSPTRKQRDRSSSPSSENDSDASQHTYDKSSATSTLKRTEITKKKLVDSFNDVNIQKSLQSTEDITVTSPKKQSPEKTVPDTNVETVKEDSKTDSRKTFTSSITTDTRTNQHVSDTQSTVRKTDSTDKSPVYSPKKDVISKETIDIRETDNLYYPSGEPSPRQCISEDVILAERKHAESTQETTDISDTRESVILNGRVTTTTEDKSSVVYSETDDVASERSSPTKKELLPSRTPSSPVKDYAAPKSSPKNIPQEVPSQPDSDTTEDTSLKQTAIIETNLIFTQKSPSPPKETAKKTYASPKEKALSPTKETVITKSTAYASPKERSPSPPKSPVAISPSSQKSPKERSPSPQKESTVKKTTAYITPKDRSPSPQIYSKERSPSPHRSPKESTTLPQKDYKEKSPSPQRSPKEGTVSPQKDTKQRSPSPHKSPKERTPSPQKFPKERSPSPQKNREEISQTVHKKERSPSPHKIPKERSLSPQKFPKERSPSPGKTPKGRSQSPQKGPKERSPSPPKHTFYKSPREKYPSPDRTTTVYVSPKLRTVSPQKETVIKKSTTYEREESVKKIDVSSKKDIRQPTKPTSPMKDDTVMSRVMSPNKQPVYKRPATEKTKPSAKHASYPQKQVVRRTTSTEKEIIRTDSPEKDKSPVYDGRSPSISPCSSPERNTEVTRITTETTIKLSTTDKPDGNREPQTATRPTRRSSIPRSEKTSVVKKAVDKKTDIHIKEVERRTKPVKDTQSFRKTTDSPVSRGTHTVVTTTLRTMVRKPVDYVKKEPSKPTRPTNFYKTQSPQSPSKKPVTSPVTKISVTPKKLSPKVKENAPVKTSAVKKTTTVIDTRSTQVKPKSKEPVKHTPAFDVLSQDEDRSSAVSSPETVRPIQPHNIYPNDSEESDVYEDDLQKDITRRTTDSTVQLSGVTDYVTLESNITNHKVDIDVYKENIENEKPPEYFPDDEYDEKYNVPEELIPEIAVVESKRVDKITNVKSKTHKSVQDTHKASQDTLTVRKTISQTPKTPSTLSARKPGPLKSYTSPVKKPASPQANKPLTTQPKPDTVRKTLDKTTPQKQITKKQTSKQELDSSRLKSDTLTKQKKVVSKVTHTKRIAETGIATRNVSAAQKRTTITKKKDTKIESHTAPSSSEDDEEDVTEILTDIVDEKTYIQELEDLRREEENTYASKVVSTSDQESGLLSVIVQHPTSSRESSPEYALLEQPSCTVSDDGSSHPRYADVVSEPEDVDTFYTQDVGDDTTQRNTSEAFINKERHYEKITDLDEGEEADDVKLNVSVADRVSQFLEQTKTENNSVRREDVTHSTESGTKSVLKAKTMFENIAKKQVSPPAPNNKPVDILSRPSIFEARRGQTAPKKVTSDITATSTITSDEFDQTRHVVHDERNINRITDSYKPDTTSAPNEDDYPEQIQDKFESHEIRYEDTTYSHETTADVVQYDTQKPASLPQKQLPATENVDITKKQVAEKKKIFSTEEQVNRHKPVEKENVVHTGEISSRKAFFERKAHDLSTSTTKDNTALKKETVKTKSFKANEKPVSQTTPDRKFVINKDKQVLERVSTDTNDAIFIQEETDFSVSTTLNEADYLRKHSTERNPYEDEDIPEEKPATIHDVKTRRRSPEPKEAAVPDTDKLRRRPSEVTQVSTPEKLSYGKTNRESPFQRPGRQSPSRESPDQKVTSTPYKKIPSRLSPERKGPEPEPKRITDRPSRKSPERKELKSPQKPTADRLSRESPERKELRTPQKPTFDRPSRESPERKELRSPQKPSADRPSRESPERKELISPQKPSADRPSRDSPERKEVKSPLKPSTYKPSRQSPESKDIPSPLRPSTDRPSRQSPERKDVKSPHKPIADKPSRQSPERREVTSPLRPSSDKPSRQSPERKDVRSPQKPITNKPSRESPERKELRSPQKPSTDRPSRESPERKDIKLPQKPSTDRPSRTSVEYKEVKVLPKTTTDKQIRVSPDRNEPVSLKKLSIDRGSRESPERKTITAQVQTTNYEETVIRRTSLKRDSPDRYSPNKEDQTEPVELNRAGKFGVTLRRTSSTGSATTQRRRSSQGDSTLEIEDIHELALLEQMMEKAVGYEQRRRIRAQIRIVKRDLEEKQSTTTKRSETSRTSAMMSSAAPLSRSGTKSPTCSPTRDAKTTKKTTQEQIIDTTRTTGQKQFVSTSRRPSSPTKPLQEPLKKQPHDSRKTSDTTESLSLHKSVVTNGYHKAEHEHTSITTVRTEKRVEATREVSATDSITSSYGVGPTDENGLPLFGLKALRRSNTIKTITNEVEESETPKPTAEPEVCDARGRPLFGLKALQTSGDYETMPEQKTSQQLKELVEKHEKNARAPESQPRQKPRAKLRDSFILQQDEGHVTNVLEDFNSEQRGLSLRSIIQKHENISHSGGSTHQEIDSSTTVVSTKSVMDSDGSVSVTRDILQGEMSCKNGDEPVGKIVQTKYSYHSPKTEDNKKGTSKTNKVTTTTVIGNQRLSGPKISETEDDDIHTKHVTTVRKTSGPTVTEYDDDDEEESEIKRDKSSIISSYKKRLSTDENKVTAKSFHRHEETDEDDEPVQRRSSGNFVSLAVRKFSGSKTADTDNDDEEMQQNVSTSKFSKSSHKQQVVESTEASVAKSSSVRRQIFKDEHNTSTSTEEKKKALIRGDSVRALQHKFQQASENAANMTQRSYPKAGLILRTSSFSSSEERDNSMKQSSNVKQSRHDSPEKVSQTKSEQIIESVSTSKVRRGSSGVDKSESSVSTTTTTKKAASFLDNTSRVTGVQDILTRMKNADLVVESGDTNEDTEARALLNKFLGASVILQGMEQGMKSDSVATPGSAALVSRVEKQRIATSNRKQEEDIDNIWDEKQLHILLEACSDYEGRRKIRQRLRTVMAEHKACADVVADAGEDVSNSSVSQECFESKHMSTKTGSSTLIQSEAHSRTTSSSSRLTKANSVTSPFAKFKQLERQNSAPSSGSTAPLFKFTDPKLNRSASTVKERLLNWVQAQTKEYKNIQIENFSTSWSNGLAFCALIHHFCPDAFDYDKLTPDQRRYNFELAFRVAEEEADIAPLLDVDDMVAMRRPDWKCVFTYVQSVYRRFHTSPGAVRC